MTSIRKSKIKKLDCMRKRMKDDGKLKRVTIEKSQPLSIKIGLMKMGFDVSPENTNPPQ